MTDTAKEIGFTQYANYVRDIIKERSVKIQEPIKNSPPLFKRPLPEKPAKLKQQLASLKGDCNLFSHLYIASKFRNRYFLADENQPWL